MRSHSPLLLIVPARPRLKGWRHLPPVLSASHGSSGLWGPRLRTAAWTRGQGARRRSRSPRKINRDCRFQHGRFAGSKRLSVTPRRSSPAPSRETSSSFVARATLPTYLPFSYTDSKNNEAAAPSDVGADHLYICVHSYGAIWRVMYTSMESVWTGVESAAPSCPRCPAARYAP